MSEVLCVRHTLEDHYGTVFAWRIVPQSVERVDWPEPLRARADMEGWITKRTDPFWHNYGEDIPETTAEVWQVIATDLYHVLSRMQQGEPGSPSFDAQALRAMAAYDAETGWQVDPEQQERYVVEMPKQSEAYLG